MSSSLPRRKKELNRDNELFMKKKNGTRTTK